MFYLRRNEPINLRVAQARLLLENGLRPQRLIFVILPIDVMVLGSHSLSSIYVTDRGAITYRVRLPAGPLAALIKHSRLAQLCMGAQRTRGIRTRSFHAGRVGVFLTPSLSADLRTFTRVLADASRKYGVAVTVLLIPNREQIFGKTGFALQDAVAGMCREEGIDCFDARRIFLDADAKPTLFLPDWHFTPRGNQMLFAGLLSHFDAMKTNTGGAPK